MTEKQTNKFTDFTFGQKYNREVRRKKTKNGFHHQWSNYSMVLKHLTDF